MHQEIMSSNFSGYKFSPHFANLTILGRWGGGAGGFGAIIKDEWYYWYHNTIGLLSEASHSIAGVVRINSCETNQYAVDQRIFCEQNPVWPRFDFPSALHGVMSPELFCGCHQLLVWTTQLFWHKLQHIQASYITISTELGHQSMSSSSKMYNSHRYCHFLCELLLYIRYLYKYCGSYVRYCNR